MVKQRKDKGTTQATRPMLGAEAARLAGVPLGTFRKHAQRGLVRSTRTFNGYRLFDLKDVMEYKSRQAGKAE